MMEAQIGIMCPQAQERWSPQELEETGRTLPGAPRGRWLW